MRILLKRFSCLLLLIMIIITDVIGGLTLAEANVPPITRDGITLLLPGHQVLMGEEILARKLTTPFTYNVGVDPVTKEVRITINACDFEYKGYLDQTLQVKESVFIFKNPLIIKIYKHDKRVTKLDETGKKLEITYYLNNCIKEYKKIPVDQNAVDSDTLVVFLQGMLLKKVANFNLDVIQKAKGIKVNANFKLLTASDQQIISLQDTFPDQFKRLSKQLDQLYFYVLELTGMPGLVYPYKYYFVFQKELPYQAVAYWGGAPKEEECGYFSP